jgi:Carboxypeptidase regulatory-like domain
MRPWLLLLSFLTLAATAQNNSAKPGTGTVTGHVYCVDTNAPARAVAVQLKPVKEAKTPAGAHSHDNGEPVGGVVETALDGSFVIPNVPPGAYYVAVTAAGYLSPRIHEDDDPAPQPPAGQPPIAIPKVDVEADQNASIDLRLERGAAISGAIRFDDGSPATGVVVIALYKRKDKWVPSSTGDYGAFAMTSSLTTDDLGHYRISGLRDREYILQATLVHVDLMPAGTPGFGLSGALRNSLAVYSGDVMRQSDAVPFKLGPGEERTGTDIVIPLSKLHSISGIVTAASDGHPINSGHVSIEDPTDKEHVGEAELGNDGAFRLEAVPEGTYTLRVQSPSDKQEQESFLGNHHIAFSETKTIHQYGDLEQTIKVEGDIPNLVLAVPEQTKQHAAQ